VKNKWYRFTGPKGDETREFSTDASARRYARNKGYTSAVRTIEKDGVLVDVARLCVLNSF
jgi:hypothetical protein